MTRWIGAGAVALIVDVTTVFAASAFASFANEGESQADLGL